MFGFTNLDIFSGGRTSHTSGIPVRSNGPRGVIWSGGNVSQHFPLVNSITPQKLGKTLFLCHRDLMKSGISGKVVPFRDLIIQKLLPEVKLYLL